MKREPNVVMQRTHTMCGRLHDDARIPRNRYPGPGDEETWGPVTDHANDPRRNLDDEDIDIDPVEWIDYRYNDEDEQQ